MVKKDFVVCNQSKLCYTVYGSGSDKMLAFHGFGQSGEVFSEFEKACPEYTIYAFDLFYFGESKWEEDMDVLEPGFWKTWMERFLDKENIDKFSIVGFSLGAKLALLTFELYYTLTERILLIAPDGIKPSLLYRMATQYVVPKAYFRYIIRHPNTFFRLLYILGSLRLIDKGTGYFVVRQMDSLRKRRKAYDAWMLYRNIWPSNPTIADLINRSMIPVIFILGEKDRVIDGKKIVPLMSRLSRAEVVELPCSHHKLLEKTAYWLAADNG